VFAQQSACSSTDVGAADGRDAKPLTLGVGDAEEPSQPVCIALLVHFVGPLQYRCGLGLGQSAAHALGGQLQRADRIMNIFVVVPNPGAEPAPKVIGICSGDATRMPFDLAAPDSGQVESASPAASRLHAALCALAQAML
jgi:hypothetical protein